MPFERLIRFVDNDGNEHYGNSNEPVNVTNIVGSTVELLEGSFGSGFRAMGKRSTVKKLLSPVSDTPIFQCIGLNYRKHANEAGLNVPTFPVVFTKPADALAGPSDDIVVAPEVQAQLDYEGELVVVMGKDAKNVKAADSLNYVLGYTIGNDVSARDYQISAASGGQFCYAKSFDTFAPVGPCIASSNLVSDPHALELTTKVNGEVRQKTSTSDMIWRIEQLIEHLSRGTTLRAGTCIMTGTPSGIGLFMQPPTFLKSGDIVEVEVGEIGAIRNKVVFE